MMIDRLSQEQQDIIKRMQSDVPIHIVPMAESLGVSVFKNNGFPDSLSGLIKKVDRKYQIHVNGNHPITRRRFTMAHELAHFLLHSADIGDGIVDDYLYRSEALSSQKEVEANNLAAELLMPEDKLLDDPAYKTMTVSKQADMFWVSKAAMDIRLGRLLR